jgi:uncharacterized protein (DUF302 family)
MSEPYVLTVHLAASPDDAEPRVREALQEQGFGVLTEIDVQATLRAKLDHEMPTYLILGACNPALAKRAIEADPDIGAMLPCNVVLRAADAGGTEVVIADPLAMLAVGGDAVREVAEEARTRLDAVASALTG